MSHFLRGLGEPKIERHFTRKPCGDCAGRFGLDFKRKTAVQRTAVGRDCRFDITVSVHLPQNAWYWQKSCSNEKDCSYQHRPMANATTGGLHWPLQNPQDRASETGR